MLKFVPLSSDIELPFFTSLASHKINHDKLDDSSRRLLGLYEIRPSDHPSVSCRMQIHGNAFTNDQSVRALLCALLMLLTIIVQGYLQDAIEQRVTLGTSTRLRIITR